MVCTNTEKQVNEKENLVAYQTSLQAVRDAHAEEARLAQKIVAGISGLQRSAKKGLFATDAQRVALAQANDALNAAERKADTEIQRLANSYLE
jgi:hypothetical protein